MDKSGLWYGFYLTIAAALAHGFLGDTALMEQAPLVVLALVAAAALVLTTLTALYLDGVQSKAHDNAQLQQAEHERRMRIKYPPSATPPRGRGQQPAAEVDIDLDGPSDDPAPER